MGGNAARELEHSIRLKVDPRIVGGQYRLGRDHRGLAPHRADEVDGVTPDVHERPAAEVSVEPDVAGLHNEVGDAEVEVHPLHIAEHPGREHLDQTTREAVQPVVEADERSTVRSIRRIRDLCRRRSIRRERLLAQHVLARLERAHRPLRLHGRRQRDVDEIDIGVSEHGGVVARVGHTEAIRGIAGPFGVARADRDHAHSVEIARRLDDRPLGDPRGPEDADAEVTVCRTG